jgi:hypothetical protein
MSGWEVRGIPGNPENHVVPVEDIKPHFLDRQCWCGPTPDDVDDDLIVHHAMDKREEYECGRRPS